MKDYKFYVGQLVRIGNTCAPDDSNYHKRGIVRKIEGEFVCVDMIDPFTSGETDISWLKKRFWEPYKEVPFVCKSLL